jgi:hypothetical protein
MLKRSLSVSRVDRPIVLRLYVAINSRITRTMRATPKAALSRRQYMFQYDRVTPAAPIAVVQYE